MGGLEESNHTKHSQSTVCLNCAIVQRGSEKSNYTELWQSTVCISLKRFVRVGPHQTLLFSSSYCLVSRKYKHYDIYLSANSGLTKGSFPIVVLTQSDGSKLLSILNRHGDNVLARLDAESDVDTQLPQSLLQPSIPALKEGDFNFITMLYTYM